MAELPQLAFDHRDIVHKAVERVRAKYRERPDPRRLLGEPFTLLELQRVHEAVLGERLQKDTFRRRMLPGLLETDTVQRGSVGKLARLFDGTLLRTVEAGRVQRRPITDPRGPRAATTVAPHPCKR